MSRKISQIILVAIFLGAIFASPAWFFVQSRQDVSVAENRKLAALPALPSDRATLQSYPARFEGFFNDHFGLRGVFLAANVKVRRWLTDLTGINVIDNAVSGRIIKGRDGWLFLNRIDGNPLDDYRNLDTYSDRELWLATITYAARNHWLNSQGIKFLLFFAPNKHTIYPEYLPAFIGRKGGTSAMDQIYEQLSRYTTVPFVDLRPPLTEGKADAVSYFSEDKQDARLFWKTDSHWNGVGADIAQYAIARAIEGMFPGMINPSRRPLEDFRYLPGRGDLIRYLPVEEQYEEKVPVIHDGRCAAVTVREMRDMMLRTECDQGHLDALIYHDSFFMALKPFMADYFARALFLWTGLSQLSMEERIVDLAPQLVIEELAERSLPYVPDIRGELYGEFWAANYEKWDRLLYTLERSAVSMMVDARPVTSPQGVAGHDILILEAFSDDPQLYFEAVPFERDRLYMMKIVIESEHETDLQLFFSDRDKRVFPSERYSEIVGLHSGENTVYIPLFGGNLGEKIRLDPGKRQGVYSIKLLEIKGIENFESAGVWR